MTREMLISIKEELAKQGKTLSPNSNYFKEYKETLTGLSQSQKDSAIGHLLGDARIEQAKSGNGHLMKFFWASKEYAHDVYEQFKSYVITPPREQKRINTSGNENITWCFQTIVHPDLDYLGDLFLQDGKKVLNDKVYENISPHTLACWFMDDGGMNGSHSHGLQFHTQGFSHFEVNKLCEILNSRYKFNAWMGVNKSKPVINIPANQYKRFLEITGEYIYDSMKHKFRMR